MPVAKRARDRQARGAGERLERRTDGLAGADPGEHLGQVLGERAVAAPHHPVERGDGALPRRHREGEQLGDGRELGEDLAFTVLDLGAEPVVAEEHPAHEAEHAEHRCRADAAMSSERAQQAQRCRAPQSRSAPTPPARCGSPGTLWRSPARSSRRRTDVLPPSTRSTTPAVDCSSGPKMPAAAEVGGDDDGAHRRSAVTLRKVAQVGKHAGPTAVVAGGTPRARRSSTRPAPAIPAERQAAPHQGAHERILFSTGRRPIRIIAA